MLKRNIGNMILKLSDFLLLYSTEIFMINETSRIIGMTILGEIKNVSNGTAKSEKPKPVVPCRSAARKIMIEPRMRI